MRPRKGPPGRRRTPAAFFGAAFATAAGFAALPAPLGLLVGRGFEAIVRRSLLVGGAVPAAGLVAVA